MLQSATKFLFRASLILVPTLFLSACNPLDNKIKAGLQVETGDISTSLFLDGTYLEKAPFINKEIKPGTYTLKVQPDNAALPAYETSVTLRRGLLTVVSWLPGDRPELSGGVIYEMEKGSDRQKSELTIITIPDAGIVELDGRNKEFAPISVSDLPPGEKKYKVSLPSYNPQEHTVNLLPGYHTTITVKLAKTQYAGNANTPNPIILSPSPSPIPIASTAAQITGPLPKIAIGSKVVIKPTNFFQNGQEVLRVRAKNLAESETIGYARVGGEYAYEAETLGGWHKISIDNRTGWVSGQYATLIK